MLPFVVQNATKTLGLRANYLPRTSNILTTNPLASPRIVQTQPRVGGRRWTHTVKWRPVQVLDEYVMNNYVRFELLADGVKTDGCQKRHDL